MQINNIDVSHFRNYHHFFIEFDKGVNILIGGNGQGKTNLIEAIYLLSVCRSFRTRINDQMIGFDSEFARVKGEVYSNARIHSLEVFLSKNVKRAKADGSDILKISGALSSSVGVFTNESFVTTSILSLIVFLGFFT